MPTGLPDTRCKHPEALDGRPARAFLPRPQAAGQLTVNPLAQFQDDLLASVRQMKAGKAVRTLQDPPVKKPRSLHRSEGILRIRLGNELKIGGANSSNLTQSDRANSHSARQEGSSSSKPHVARVTVDRQNTASPGIDNKSQSVD